MPRRRVVLRGIRNAKSELELYSQPEAKRRPISSLSDSRVKGGSLK